MFQYGAYAVHCLYLQKKHEEKFKEEIEWKVVNSM